MNQVIQIDPILRRILRSCDRTLLQTNIQNLDWKTYQGVLNATRPHWMGFLSYLESRKTLSKEDVNDCRYDSGRGDNMEKILRKLATKNKKVGNLMDYLYNTNNYAALKYFDIHLEAPEPGPDALIVSEVDDLRQRRLFPPTFRMQPPENIRVEKGKPLRFEPCEAMRAKRYQWFNERHDGYLLIHESADCGTFVIPNSNFTHNGVYICKAFNDAGSALTEKIKVQIVDGEEQGWAEHLVGPSITSQPQSYPGVIGGEAHFSCTAVGRKPLTYQWCNGAGELSGETRNELTLQNVQVEDTFVCVVKDADNNLTVSNMAKLELSGPLPTETGLTASSKVALLIGNGRYKNGTDLHAVYSDIPRLSHLLRAMGFKVVCCYDLTVSEMKNVVTFFSSLMMEGVYAFVYFVGHGFYYEGQNYMLASDAHHPIKNPDEDAIVIEWMLTELHKMNPALKAIFLDICRRPPTTEFESEPVKITLETNRNTIICNATGAYGKSFEVQSENPTSFFAACLLEALQIKESVEFISFRVRQIMQRFMQGMTREIQNPVVESSLTEARSLWDPIEYTGRTREFENNILRWESANILPPPLYLNIDKVNLRIHLDFETKVTNEFRVIVTVMQDNVVQIPYLAYICARRIPQGITANVHNVSDDQMEAEGMMRTVTVFQNLQKLQNELAVHLVLISLPKRRVKVDYVLSFGKPMISNLCLWKSPEVFANEIQK